MKNQITSAIKKHIHFSRFVVVGVANTLLDLFLFFIFANIVGLHPVPASLLSTGITMVMSFHLNHQFVFESKKKKRHTIIQFAGITGFNVWLVQSGVIALVVRIAQSLPFFEKHLWSLNLFAKLCGVAISFILNFFMYRFIFHMRQSHELNTL